MKAFFVFVCLVQWTGLGTQAVSLGAEMSHVDSSLPGSPWGAFEPSDASVVSSPSPTECQLCWGELDVDSPTTLKCCKIPTHLFHVDCHVLARKNGFVKDEAYCELCHCHDRIAMDLTQKERFNKIFPSEENPMEGNGVNEDFNPEEAVPISRESVEVLAALRNLFGDLN